MLDLRRPISEELLHLRPGLAVAFKDPLGIGQDGLAGDAGQGFRPCQGNAAGLSVFDQLAGAGNVLLGHRGRDLVPQELFGRVRARVRAPAPPARKPAKAFT
jgi:hypothetical protein